MTFAVSGEPAQSGQGGILADSWVLRRDCEQRTYVWRLKYQSLCVVGTLLQPLHDRVLPSRQRA